MNSTFFNNSGWAIQILSGSENNSFYNNMFIGNHHLNNWYQASDDAVNNQWDDGVSMGNFWGDYIGVGVYNIPGSAGSVDRYPFGINDSAGF